MVLLSLWGLTTLTRLRQKFPPPLVHIGIRPCIGSQTLVVGQVHVSWAVDPGIRSMARAAIPLRQTIIG
jgi:hypothetical protein